MTGTLDPAYKKVENAFIQKVVGLHSNDLRDDTSPPPSIEQDDWTRMHPQLVKRVCGGTNTWAQLNTAARSTIGRKACRHLVYDYLLKLTDCKKHPECKDTDVRELVLRHVSSLTRNSVGGSLYLLWPGAGQFLRDTVMKQDEWVNLKPRGGGKPRKRQAPENDDAAAAGGGAGAASAEDNDTAPPPLAKKAKTSPTAFGDGMNSETPDEYQCPITMEVMNDPVMAADGHTYERAAIEQWFSQNSAPILSPKTNRGLAHLHLTPNHALKALIQDHLQSRAGGGGSSSA